MIFLGLASNYSARRSFRHLFAAGNSGNSLALRQTLADKYSANLDQVALYHSGRSALTVAFQGLVSPGSPIIVPGLTCIAVIRAIKAADCTPVYVDIDRETLQYDIDKLESALASLEDLQEFVQKTTKTTPCERQKSRDDNMVTVSQEGISDKNIDKSEHVCYNGIIVAQNTLGLPLDMQKIEHLAAKYRFAIVEDLAHCAGRFYPDGREIGTIGQATALSFGKGKSIDTITGGAVIMRDKTYTKTLSQPTKKPKLSARLRDRWYPILAGISRSLWRIGIGKALLALFLFLHWIEKSADTTLDPQVRLTHWQAKLALRQLQNLPTTPLREYRFVRHRAKLLARLKKHGYDFSEIWYDTPVAPARYASEADFPKQTCPVTVQIAQEIINLPPWIKPKKLLRAHEIIKEFEIGGENVQKISQ